MMKKFIKSKSKFREIKISPDAKFLVIVESPSKCQKIESFLGMDYACIASVGHLRKIEGLKFIDSKNGHTIEYSLINDKKAHIKEMEKVMKQFPKENIILATDDDREGEAIAWHICEIFKLNISTTKRIIFHEITQNAVRNAVKNPTTINMDLVTSQQARQVVDLYVGYKISPILWKYLYNNKENTLSAGRCQTPALRLVYDNYIEIKNAESEFIYKTRGTFFPKNIVFQLNKDFIDEKQVETFLEASCEFQHKLHLNSPKESIRSAPKPYNTSCLLQSASSSLSMSPKETMNLCQILYQEGLITYMRTDSQKYAIPFIEKSVKYIENHFGKDTIGNTDKITLQDSKDPHEAIRIINVDRPTINSENRRMCSLYKLIWKNTIESLMCDAVYMNTEARISAPQDLHYSYVVEVPKILGWKKVEEKTDITCEQNGGSGLLLYMQSLGTQTLKYTKIESTVNLKQKHLHYSEAGLIKQLEKMGIGRPSTFASLVETIKDRKYIQKRDVEGKLCDVNEYLLTGGQTIEINKVSKSFGGEKNKLVIEPLGILCVEFLTKYFQHLFSYDYTEEMEMALDTISSENGKYEEVCDKCYSEILSHMGPIKKLNKESFQIDDKHELVYDKYGPVVRTFDDDGNIEYFSVKRELRLEIEKLRNKEYTLEDLLETQERNVGKYNNEDCILKMGKFGLYVQYGANTVNLNEAKMSIDEIDFETVVQKIKEQESKSKSSNILRELNNDLSIRKGKYGAYIFYQTPEMSKPEFFNLRKFPQKYTLCDKEVLIDWIKTTYLDK